MQMDATHQPPDLLTRDETAERLRISVRQLDLLVKERRGPLPTRVGGRVFFRARQIERYLEIMTEQATG
jgi:hypothetical protein